MSAPHGRFATLVLLWCAFGFLAGCSGDREARLRDARNRAVAYFEREVTEVQAGWWAIFAYLQRRFGVVVRTTDGRTIHDATAVVPAETYEIFRRLVDPGAGIPIERIAALDSPVDRISASAIHCDRIPLPKNWVGILSEASRKGGYFLTHAVAAAEWSLENGCLSEMQIALLHAEQVPLLVELIEDRERLEARHRVGTDVWIEALAMLFYAGAGARARPEWIGDLLDRQNPDGSWPAHPGSKSGDPHASALGLWVTLEALAPGARRTTWLPRREG